MEKGTLREEGELVGIDVNECVSDSVRNLREESGGAVLFTGGGGL